MLYWAISVVLFVEQERQSGDLTSKWYSRRYGQAFSSSRCSPLASTVAPYCEAGQRLPKRQPSWQHIWQGVQTRPCA